MRDWGTHLTVHIYHEAEADFNTEDAIEKINASFPDAHFVGMKLESVRDEPKDQ